MSEILGIARFRFHEGKREEYLRLSEQARELVEANEPGTLGYDLYLNADQSECVVIERYRDSEAAMQHAGGRVTAIVDDSGIVPRALVVRAGATRKGIDSSAT
jgi:quinol monooxygenase YgiN